MVMTRFEQSLQSYLTSTDFIEPFEVLDIVIQLLKALEIVHESGSTHNDLNLDNIMIQEGEGKTKQVTLIDYG